mgnify:CR=1 FL=1
MVINAVGIIREHGAQSFDNIHTRAPKALFAACVKAGVKKVIQISALGADALTTAVAAQDRAAVARANGVGPKLAQRIVSELRDRAPAFAPADPALAKLQGEIDGGRPTPVGEAVSALVHLGYNQAQAGAAVSGALRNAPEGAATETLIRLALRELAT